MGLCMQILVEHLECQMCQTPNLPVKKRILTGHMSDLKCVERSRALIELAVVEVDLGARSGT